MDIHIVSPNDYGQIHRLRDYCFPNKYSGARREDFHYWIEQSTTLGAYDDKNCWAAINITAKYYSAWSFI